MFRTSSIDDTKWSNYLHNISSKFCPFMLRSMDFSGLKFSKYDVPQVQNVDEYCFALGVAHVEILKCTRSAEISAPISRLMCENIIFTSSLPPPEQEIFFQWPHWGLKLLYTEEGLIFGKFWPDEKFFSRDRLLVPNPPQLLLSIRSTIGTKDAQFFSVSPALADKHSRSSFYSNLLLRELNSKAIAKFSALVANVGHSNITAVEVLEAAREISSERILRQLVAKDAFISLSSNH